MLRTTITRADIIPAEDYARIRVEKRREAMTRKRNRRMDVGPFATAYFENFETMWRQIQEMLHIERGGEAQIADELRAYAPLIPNGRELVATFMMEIADPERRSATLSRLTGVEACIFLEVGGETSMAVAENEVERTRDDGKTSSVHFLHFPLTAAQIAAFRTPGARIVLGVNHPAYAHMALMPEAVRLELSGDLVAE